MINKGDICIYRYHKDFPEDKENLSVCLVEVKKLLSEYVSEVSFIDVFIDDTGNGLFNYLLANKKTMNVSNKYLHHLKVNMFINETAKSIFMSERVDRILDVVESCILKNYGKD